MYIEFNDEEKSKLLECGFTEQINHQFIHSTDVEQEELFIELKKLPDNSLEATIHFCDGETEVIPFPSFESFYHLTNIKLR